MSLSLFLHNRPEIPSAVTEVTVAGKLIRGSDAGFVDRLLPEAQKESLQLNLAAVSQIDAAGVATLIALYQASNNSGHQLTIIEPSEQVHEVLHLVGLEHLLIAKNQTCDAGYRQATLTAA